MSNRTRSPTLEMQKEPADDWAITAPWWPIIRRFRPSKVFPKWTLIDQGTRVDPNRNGKTIPRRMRRRDAIVSRANSTAANGSRCKFLPSAPDVGVGNVFSVCSASYRPEWLLHFYPSRPFQRRIYHNAQRAVRNITDPSREKSEKFNRRPDSLPNFPSRFRQWTQQYSQIRVQTRHCVSNAHWEKVYNPIENEQTTDIGICVC